MTSGADVKHPARDYIELLDDARRCRWCRYPYKKVYRSGLCRHCYAIDRDIAAAQRRLGASASRVPRPSEAQQLASDLDLRTSQQMAELARAEGVAYGSLADRNVTGLDLEHQFSMLSDHLLRKASPVLPGRRRRRVQDADLFYSSANVFNYSFDAEQKRLLFHFLSLLNREYARRHRRRIAGSQAVRSYAR